MKRSMSPMKLSMYRLWLGVGTFAILIGIVFVAYPLIDGGGYPEGDFWLMTIPIGVGVAFVLQAVLTRRFVGIEEDDAPGWDQLAGTLGLALLAAFGGKEWLNGTFGHGLSAIIFIGLIFLALGATKWFPRPWDKKGA